MVTKELNKYIKECREKGFSDLEIRNALIEKGWNQKDVLEAILARPTKHLPKWVSWLGLAFMILLFAAIVWSVFFMLNDIRRISDEVTIMVQRTHKAK